MTEQTISNGEQQENSQEESNEDFVPKRAYQEVASDMHKYKNSLKQTQAELNELRAKLDEQAKQEKVKNEQFKALWEEEQAEKQRLAEQLKQQSEKFVYTQKLNAVKSQLPLQKDDFAKFIDLDSVSVDENGNIDANSVKQAAEKFKQEFPMLLKQKTSSPLANHAPQRFDSSDNQKPVTKMTKAEVLEAFKAARRKDLGE